VYRRKKKKKSVRVTKNKLTNRDGRHQQKGVAERELKLDDFFGIALQSVVTRKKEDSESLDEGEGRKQKIAKKTVKKTRTGSYRIQGPARGAIVVSPMTRGSLLLEEPKKSRK